jgi:alkylation response protein AidB-like acyl-CoA dehydrogenase
MSIDLNLSEDQRQITASVQDVLADRFPLGRFRNTRGGDRDQALFSEIVELGWLGLGVAEEAGGAGFTLVEEMLLFRELGRHLVTPSVLASVLGVHLALALGKDDFAAEIVAGTRRVALANVLAGGGNFTHAVLDGAGCDWLLFWDETGFTCMPQKAASPGHAGRSIDRTLSLQRVALGGGERLHLAGHEAAALRRRADVLIAAQMLGLTQAAQEVSVEYAKLREQFGQPIGAFQAIKHRCTDMKLREKVLEALVTMAALAEHNGDADADVQIASARLLGSRYALENGAAGIQIHGAMGYTAECDAHLFVLRAHVLDSIGSTNAQREASLAALETRNTHR